MTKGKCGILDWILDQEKDRRGKTDEIAMKSQV